MTLYWCCHCWKLQHFQVLIYFFLSSGTLLSSLFDETLCTCIAFDFIKSMFVSVKDGRGEPISSSKHTNNTMRGVICFNRPFKFVHRTSQYRCENTTMHPNKIHLSFPIASFHGHLSLYFVLFILYVTLKLQSNQRIKLLDFDPSFYIIL